MASACRAPGSREAVASSRQRRRLSAGISGFRVGTGGAVLALVALTLNIGAVDAASPASAPGVRLETTPSARTGDTVVATLSIADAARAGGYEAQLLFDPSLARVGDVSVPGGLRHTWGRPAHALGPVERSDGSVGVRSRLPIETGNAPITSWYDDYQLVAAP